MAEEPPRPASGRPPAKPKAQSAKQIPTESPAQAPPTPPPSRPRLERQVVSVSGTRVLRDSYRPWWQKNLIPLCCGGVVLLVSLGWWLMSGSGSTPQNPNVNVAENKPGQEAAGELPDDKLAPPKKPVRVQIQTPEPGFVLFVDEEPLYNAKGELQLTPCEFTVESGRHVLIAAKKGWVDIPRIVDITDDTEFVQEATYEPFNTKLTTVFNAPYLTAEVGKPIALSGLKLSRQTRDPMLSFKGTELWYAGYGPEGAGVYTSTRPGPYEEWEEPSLLLLSRGVDLPASPSVTDDGHLVSFTIPGKLGRVWGLARKEEAETFDAKQPLKFSTSEKGNPEWPSAQLSSDGMRLYWLEVQGEQRQAYLASRKDRTEEFGKPRKISLPGGHPCLSQDELRQYLFDGKVLRRARRAKIGQSFAEPETIAELNLADYVVAPNLRQFWVSEDEQWLYYAPNPEESGELFVVRLSIGPRRGVLVRGKSIPVKKQYLAQNNAITPEQSEEMEEKPETTTQAPPVDPRAVPLPYAAFRTKWEALLGKRDYAGANALLDASEKREDLNSAKELLAWDREELTAIETCWGEIRQVVSKLMPGDALRIGGAAVTFEKLADETLHYKNKTKEYAKKLVEMSGGDLMLLFDRLVAKDDAAGQYRAGVFLSYEGKGSASASKLRLDRADALAEIFREHLAQRQLFVIRGELERENLNLALKLIDDLTAHAPKSPATQEASKLKANVYDFIKWREVGRRKWSKPETGTFACGPDKSNDSLLIAPQEYGDFEISLEWMTTTPNGQGGVYFHYPGSGNPMDTAFKIHLANDAGVVPDKYCTGSLFNIYPPSENAAKPAGQWNTLRVLLKGDSVLVHVNGKKVLETIATDPEIPKRGYIALDGELGGITYRKILLTEPLAEK